MRLGNIEKRKCENDAECNTLNTIHTQLFELCITDFTKSCHLSHRFFLLLQSVLLCVCVRLCSLATFFFCKESQACHYHRNRLHCFFTLASSHHTRVFEVKEISSGANDETSITPTPNIITLLTQAINAPATRNNSQRERERDGKTRLRHGKFL